MQELLEWEVIWKQLLFPLFSSIFLRECYLNNFSKIVILIKHLELLIFMFWKILLYLFLILAFLIFLKLSTVKLNGKRIFNLPVRITIALLFPLFFVLVALFGSLLFLFVMSLLLLALLLFFLLFFMGKVHAFYKKSRKNPLVIHRVKKK